MRSRSTLDQIVAAPGIAVQTWLAALRVVSLRVVSLRVVSLCIFSFCIFSFLPVLASDLEGAGRAPHLFGAPAAEYTAENVGNDATTPVEILSRVEDKEVRRALLGLYYHLYGAGLKRRAPDAKQTARALILELKSAVSDRILLDREASSLEKGLVVLFFQFGIDDGTLDEARKEFLVIMTGSGIQRSRAAAMFTAAEADYVKLEKQREISEMSVGALMEKYVKRTGSTNEVESSITKHTYWRGNRSSGEVLIKNTRVTDDEPDELLYKYKPEKIQDTSAPKTGEGGSGEVEGGTE